ncbi:alpha/beta fold hydrolase [Streptomyces sp. NPDC058954]|uniref:alpha/beta fold hydrolase n=1 Tax=Streptomyces sp. NPDC058954 TaxID=3346677 RepID=UPI0036CB4ACA
MGWRDQWELLEHYPRMTHAAVDGAGHNVHLDRPSVVQALLGDWLDTLTAEARNPVNRYTKPAITAYEKR